ncbi:MAG: IS4/IS5 family transposase, partial [Planctomycetaceae bacterium]|nr:IS4/IS5 family transposase [Planctomycetaceae bacterium]
QATGGRKEYKNDDGTVTKVVEWFGFKLQLLIDVKHEVALSYEITQANVGDGETLPTLVKQAQQILPEHRIKTLAYDKAADSNDVHELLDAADITPLIPMRSLWQSEPERCLPGHDGRSNIADDGNVTGSRRFFAKVGTVLAVHAAFATLLAAARRPSVAGDSSCAWTKDTMRTRSADWPRVAATSLTSPAKAKPRRHRIVEKGKPAAGWWNGLTRGSTAPAGC